MIIIKREKPMNEAKTPKKSENTVLGEKFEEALIFATQTHNKQFRKSTKIPYISHLMSVTALVLEYGGSEDVAIAALLHDAVEDQGGQEMANEIRQRFGEVVAKIVLDCSDTDEMPKPPWRNRKEKYLEHLKSANPMSVMVSAADKLHNIRCILSDYRQIGDEVWKRFNAGREDLLWFYFTFGQIISDKMPKNYNEEYRGILEQLFKDKY
jgi:(p)ppGpp synthase/HD superfamily hydrolase